MKNKYDQAPMTKYYVDTLSFITTPISVKA